MKHAIATLACALTMPLVTPAHADLAPDRLSFLVGTHHTFEAPAGETWQQVNPGVFLTWENVTAIHLDVTVGGYLNSFGGMSLTVAAALPITSWHHDTLGEGELSLFAGLATYPGTAQHFLVHWGDVVPMGGIQVRHENLYLQVLPGKEDFSDPIFAFGLTFNLGG
jgi:hypothetical protein